MRELLQLAVAFLELPVQVPLGEQAGLVLLVEMDHVLEGRGQDIQELITTGRKLEFLAEEDHAKGSRFRRSRGPRQCAADAAGDLVRVAVLGGKTIRPSLEAAQDVDRVGLAGADDDRDGAEPGVGLDPTTEVEATVAGQQQVTEHDVEGGVGEPLEAALGIGGGLHLEVGGLQGQGELPGLGGAILDDQYARHGTLLQVVPGPVLVTIPLQSP